MGCRANGMQVKKGWGVECRRQGCVLDIEKGRSRAAVMEDLVVVGVVALVVFVGWL